MMSWLLAVGGTAALMSDRSRKLLRRGIVYGPIAHAMSISVAALVCIASAGVAYARNIDDPDHLRAEERWYNRSVQALARRDCKTAWRAFNTLQTLVPDGVATLKGQVERTCPEANVKGALQR